MDSAIEQIKEEFEAAYQSLMQRIIEARRTQQQTINDRVLFGIGSKQWFDHCISINAIDEQLRYLHNRANELQHDYNLAMIKTMK